MRVAFLVGEWDNNENNKDDGEGIYEDNDDDSDEDNDDDYDDDNLR